MEEKILSSDHELRIFMEPTRQKILKKLDEGDVEMTAKQLADCFGIAPSSAGNHLRKLESIGLVELARTENIHGITAKYYRACDVDVRVRGDGVKLHSLALARSMTDDVDDFAHYVHSVSGSPAWHYSFKGFNSSGVMYLSESELNELREYIGKMNSEHHRGSGTAYKYMVTLYPRDWQEKDDSN